MVLTTVEQPADADRLAEAMVDTGLAACVQILPVRSVYRWKGRVERAGEHLLLAKTTPARASELRDWIRARHPYETPEILEVATCDGLPEYLAWIRESTSAGTALA